MIIECSQEIAPRRGMIFTSFLGKPKYQEGDAITNRFAECTGYIKTPKDLLDNEHYIGDYCRLLVTSHVEEKRHHRYFLSIPFRPLCQGENKDCLILAPENLNTLVKIIQEGRQEKPEFRWKVHARDFDFIKKLPREKLSFLINVSR